MECTNEKITIDEEFRQLIPKLSVEEYAQLEKNIITDGCREALIVWNDVLVDGHNRYEICIKNNIDFRIIKKDFKDKTDAIIWIINNQFGRRNISNYQRSILALRLEDVLKEKAKVQQGKRTDILQNSVKSYEPPEAINTQKALAKTANVSHDTIYKVKKIQEKAAPEMKAKLENGEASINEVFKEIQQVERREKIETIRKTVAEVPKGKFNVILADPPWRYDFSETDSRQIDSHYPSMELDAICNIKIPCADDGILFLWATAPKLREALKVIDAWGFEYKTHAIWVKDKIGMGYYFRNQHELLLVATKGKFHPPAESNRFSSAIHGERTEHSKKPNIIYELIEKMYPQGTYMELFARAKRNNWTGWGNEY